MGNVVKLFARNGIDYSAFMLNVLRRTGSVISGPDALTAWYPTAPPSGRMEIFCPNMPGAYTGMIDHLTMAEGFEVEDVIHPDRSQNPHAFQAIYSDRAFGRTVKAAITMKKSRPTVLTQFTCIILICSSTDSPLPTVMELPSTLFMNAITGSSLVSFYPGYTFNAEGLMNYEDPVLPRSIPSTNKFQNANFNVLMKIPRPFATDHRCGFHYLCPNMLRNTLDNRSAITDITRVYEDDPIPQKAGRRLVVWRLRCAGKCGEGMLPEPYQMESVVAVYVTQNFVVVDSW
ncbi:hypothetical protein DFP72DRAFT_1058061 [Ephemerocybe angulata]|uniref:Uncharacterized protein n=1 Tax=Ephemerocybe angulata TaxID=980116 RepID=A0A8H6IJP7_9AGAR|nr:hypothetical protein DFP72DRAFT_1058061 [Tulosesus angulatus]